MQHSPFTTSLVALGTAAIALAAPSVASASTASLAKGALTITDQPGHASVMTVSEPSNPLRLASLDKVVVTADAAITGTPSGCAQPLSTQLICNRSAVGAVDLNLGDGDDQVLRPVTLSVLGVDALPVDNLPVNVNGGDGNDQLQGGDAADTIDGGAGDDHLFGFGGNDTLLGGGGVDTVEPGTGVNSVDVSGAEADTVAVTPGSVNNVMASANDIFVGSGATNSISLLGVNVGPGLLGSGGTPDTGSTGANVDAGNSNSPGGTSSNAGASTGTSGVTASATITAGVPSVDDLLGGVRGSAAEGSLPLGVLGPVQPVVSSLVGVAGATAKANLAARVPTSLPTGVTLDQNALHITLACTDACDAIGNGVIDIGGGTILKLHPAIAKIQGAAKATLNLGIDPAEYVKLTHSLSAGSCVVVGVRMHVMTKAGDEVQSYALPACGARVIFKAKQHPIVNAKMASRTFRATAQCSAKCWIKARFIEVKLGDRVLARTNWARITATGSGTDYITTWNLSKKQAAAIKRAAGRSHQDIRYVISTDATSGGVATSGSASFRAEAK